MPRTMGNAGYPRLETSDLIGRHALTCHLASQLLPSYLKYEIKFAPEMRLKLVSRIMEHLGRSGLQPEALEG